jgi:hypothetical protein
MQRLFRKNLSSRRKEASFRNANVLLERKKYGHGSQRGPKPRISSLGLAINKWLLQPSNFALEDGIVSASETSEIWPTSTWCNNEAQTKQIFVAVTWRRITNYLINCCELDEMKKEYVFVSCRRQPEIRQERLKKIKSTVITAAISAEMGTRYWKLRHVSYNPNHSVSGLFVFIKYYTGIL